VALEEKEGVALAEGESVGLEEGVAVREGVGVAVDRAVLVAVGGAVRDIEGEAEALVNALPDLLLVTVFVPEGEPVLSIVSVADGEGVLQKVPNEESVPVTLGDPELVRVVAPVAVLLGLPVMVRGVVGVREGEEETEEEWEEEGEPEGLRGAVFVGVGRGDTEGVLETEEQGEEVRLGQGVGEVERVVLVVRVPEWQGEGVGVLLVLLLCESVEVRQGEAELEAVGMGDFVRDTEVVWDAEAQLVEDVHWEGDFVKVRVVEVHTVGVLDRVPLGDCECKRDVLPERDALEETEEEGEKVMLTVGLCVGLSWGEALGLSVGVSVGEGSDDTERVAVEKGEEEVLGVVDTLRLGQLEGDGVAVVKEVGEGEDEAWLEAVATVAEGERVPGEAEVRGEVEGKEEAQAEGLALCEEERHALPVSMGVLDTLRVPQGEGEGDRDPGLLGEA
jgi:hypothetical protein